MLNEIALSFGTLFAIVNPISTAFVFNRLTAGQSKAAKHRLSRTASLAAAMALWAFLAIGQPMMSFFGITLYAFRVAGGLYLGKVAFDMLGRQPRHSPDQFQDSPENIAIIPLAIPLLAGPGAMTTVMVLRESYSWIPVALAILAVCTLSWLVLSQASRFDQLLGKTGSNVIERVLGLLVLVISVQFVFNGISGYLASR
ncbi:MAG: MarC family protein [Planctomycetes bacterium]|nr:MarC family protein [Planctomycetota bacterium]MCB9910830.1 MarC family protein [Planctomycetota bacterium]MCB9912238.1 MarC family protein [Planctomycetota bacterium]HPF13155.1 MarC family protein [Planctomycetota bacterium]HRV80284.1 MarC family protein [Planctomycetota bacterium]